MNDIIDALKSIINANYTIGYDATTRFKAFIPESYPAICYEPDFFNEDRQSMNMTLSDKKFSLNLYYVKKAAINRDMTSFIDKVESIMQTLRQNGDLNKTVMYFNANIKYSDRKPQDNIEFIAKIIITGKKF